MTEKKVILVTGGFGFVGRAIKAHVEQDSTITDEFVFLSSKDCNLANMEETKNLFKKLSPYYVIHLAARYPSENPLLRDVSKTNPDNLHAHHNVLKCCIEFQVKKCICILSTAMFPDKCDHVFDETMIHNGPPAPSVYGYAFEKRYLEILSRVLNEVQQKTLFVPTILSNIYGKDDNFNVRTANVMPSLIHKGYLAKKEGRAIKMLGSGKACRQFIYVEDLVRIFLLLLKEYESPEPIILCDSEKSEVSLREVAEIIRSVFNIEPEIEFDTSAGDGALKKTASNAKFVKAFPDFKFTPLIEGIRKTAEWLENNYSTARK